MKTVLIVEDDADNRELMRILLGLWKYRVVEARDGIEALVTAMENPPDLILMDVKLPRLDGLETAREIRGSAETCNVPIIFISGCAEAKYRTQADEIGIRDYLVKPLDFDQLEAVIARTINFSQST